MKIRASVEAGPAGWYEPSVVNQEPSNPTGAAVFVMPRERTMDPSIGTSAGTSLKYQA